MTGEQIADIRTRLETIERLLAQLATELKAIREELHVAAVTQQTKPPSA